MADESAALTDEELAELQEWSERATTGPWNVETESESDDPLGQWHLYARGVSGGDPKEWSWVVRFDDDYGTDQFADAHFIAAARNYMPRLIAALRASRTEVGRLRQGLWDIYGILGFDLDGDASPDVLVRPDLLDLVKEGATEVRAAMDEDDEEASTRFREKDREIARLSETVKGLRNAAERSDCDRSPCSCGMHRDRT